MTLVGFGLLGSAPAFAQNTSANAPVTATGCLSQGASAAQYMLKETSGKTYELSSSTVDLKAHIGHEVTVTGTVSSSQQSSTAGATGPANLQVSDLKMISTSCKQ
ncbi:MAG TPA: DUF5818 domain-containing protein [Bryobacteraceae bacterium]|nr:DUF5818 domain-containing protein [Bryobacteraceae bacterium]